MKERETDPRDTGHRPSVERNTRIVALPLLLTTLACTPPLGKLGEIASDTDGSSGGEEGEGTTTGELPPEGQRMSVLQLDDGALDLLLVIDNSGSMGTEQVRIAQAVAAFAQQVTAAPGVDLRVAFTTTDNGNPWCGQTTPEAGNLKLSACTSRLPDFVFNGASTIDSTQEACLDLCGIESIPVLPTTTHVDEVASERPWIEVGPQGSNLGEVTLEQALLCAAPQGINGCGFEQPLESMKKALERSASPSDPSYGFLRPWARLAVVLVTDEVDCSTDPAWEEIFLPEGNRVFWGDPDFAAPSSALCWNAGVECDSEGPDLGNCHPQNYDVDGNVTDSASAVMYSLTRYIEELQGVEASKQVYRPEGSVSVALIAGVPEGYAEGTAELVYTRDAMPLDPQFQSDFGVDPGCESPTGQAVPPVRQRALAELFPVGADAAVHSVCGETYQPALDTIQASLAALQLDQIACVPGCLADVDPGTDGTQVQCNVVMERGNMGLREETLLPACGEAMADEPCYLLRVGEDAPQCAAAGSNAELELVLPDGFAWQGQLDVAVACEVAAEGSC